MECRCNSLALTDRALDAQTRDTRRELADDGIHGAALLRSYLARQEFGICSRTARAPSLGQDIDVSATTAEAGQCRGAEAVRVHIMNFLPCLRSRTRASMIRRFLPPSAVRQNAAAPLEPLHQERSMHRLKY